MTAIDSPTLLSLADRVDRMERERNIVENSFGSGPFKDGLLLVRLNELDREISRARSALEASHG